MQRIRGWSYLEEWFFSPNERADKEHACMRESWERFHWSLTNLQLLLCDFCEINARSHWLFSCNDRALLARCPMYIERFHSRGQHLCKFIGTRERVQRPKDWFGTPTWPPFHCSGTPIWPPWRHVKTLYIIVDIHVMLNWQLSKGYPLTSVTWLYRGLKCTTHWGDFLKLSAGRLRSIMKRHFDK